MTEPESTPTPEADPLCGLPLYTRSLLRIEVPLIVTLAAKKQSIAQIVELGPGAIIPFGKPCHEPLDVSVGGQHVAQGEVVKIGEKFGVRLTEIVPVAERFAPVTRREK
jgi:flagellar motor switch protein FliN/FliY